MNSRMWSGLVALALSCCPLAAQSAASALDPSALGKAIEQPSVVREIPLGAALALGHGELRVEPGAKVYLLAAEGVSCGFWIKGPAALTPDAYLWVEGKALHWLDRSGEEDPERIRLPGPLVGADPTAPAPVEHRAPLVRERDVLITVDSRRLARFSP